MSSNLLRNTSLPQINKLAFIQFLSASLICILVVLDFSFNSATLQTSPLNVQHSEEKKQTENYLLGDETSSLLQKGEWIKVLNPMKPYGMTMCNFSFHSWSKYAAKNMGKRSLDVQLWVWQKFLDEYLSNANIFTLHASRFLNSFGKNRNILMIGYFATSLTTFEYNFFVRDSHMEGQFLSLACLLWSVNNTAHNLKQIRARGIRKSIQFSPEYKPISFIRWDKFGDNSNKDGE